MSSQNFIGDVLTGFAEALDPLSDALQSPQEAAVLVGELGWVLDPAAPAAAVTQAFGPVPATAVRLATAAKALAALDPSADIVAVATAIGSLAKEIAQVAGDLRALRVPAGSPPSPFDDPAFWTSLTEDVLDLLLAKYLERSQPRLLAVLRLAGIATADVVPATATRSSFVHHQIRWDRIVTLASNPPQLIADVYGWGGAFEHARFIAALADVFRLFGAPVALGEAPANLLDEYWTPDADARDGVIALSAPLHREIAKANNASNLLAVSVLAMPIPPKAAPGTSTAAPSGLTMTPELKGAVSETIAVSDAVEIILRGGFESTGTLRLDLRPVDAEVVTTLDGRVDAEARLGAAPASPWILFGAAGSTRFELAEAHLALGARGTTPDLEVLVEAAADKAGIVIDLGEGDGFLQKVLGDKPVRFDFGAGLAWSSRSGFKFIGQATLEVTIGVHQSVFGVIDIDSVTVAMGGDPAAARANLALAVSGKIKLGPIQGTVDRVGLRAQFTDGRTVKTPGNLGDAALGFGFKPPRGAGLNLDTPAVKGGGFLLLDDAKGLYAGTLRLEIKGGFAVTAIGLITTKLPDGSRGFSLLIVIAAEFPSIQLGFGFTLDGIGGLLGLNRRMDVDALRKGVRNRLLDSILFPPDPVKNATKVIADLQSVFPVAPGRFVIGLMARLGWGTPTIISVDLGVIVEIPSPIKIAILGRLALQLPKAKPVIQLKMDVLGILDFDRREASIDATIYDSRIATFTITGDMAMRLSFGSSPAFALSIGGFNKRFTPPPDFPPMNRMAISLATSDNPRLTLSAYFAKTPATVQFGARLDVYAALDAGFIGLFEVSGYLSFDALIQPFPPSFVIDIAGGVVLRRNGSILFGVEVWLTLTGPTPWHACGEATFHALGKWTIPFDITVGQAEVLPPLPPVDPLGDLVHALSVARNWTGMLPQGGNSPVTLRALEADVAAVVHPLASLTVRQEVLPLAFNINKYQNVALGSAVRFDIAFISFAGAVTPSGGSVVPGGDETRTHFATGEYVARSGEQNLSLPAFESFESGRSGIGFAAGTAAVACGTAVARPDDTFDQIVIDEAEPLPKPPAYTAHVEVLDALIASSAAGRSPTRTSGAEGYAGPSSGLELREPGYCITRRDDNGAVDAIRYETAAEAYDALDAANDPDLQVVGAHEVAA